MSTQNSSPRRRRAVARLFTLFGALLLALSLTVGPSLATEGAGEGGGEPAATEEPAEGGGHAEPTKVQLPETSRDRVGLIILGLVGLGTLLVLDNARRQLKGERDQATGEWRWR